MKIVENNEIVLNVILTENEKYAALVSRSVQISTQMQNSIKCFDKTQTFATFPIAIFIRNNSKMITSFNTIIRYAFEGGLIELWSKRIIKEKTRKDILNDISSVSMNKLYFPFILIYFVGILASIICILEIIIHKKITSQKRNRFWLLLDKLIDGKRHYCYFNDASI